MRRRIDRTTCRRCGRRGRRRALNCRYCHPVPGADDIQRHGPAHAEIAVGENLRGARAGDALSDDGELHPAEIPVQGVHIGSRVFHDTRDRLAFVGQRQHPRGLTQESIDQQRLAGRPPLVDRHFGDAGLARDGVDAGRHQSCRRHQTVSAVENRGLALRGSRSAAACWRHVGNGHAGLLCCQSA